MKLTKPIARRTWRYHGVAAAIALISAALGWPWLSPGYLHGQHPLALLGAKGMPHAQVYNVLAYLVPGLLAAHLGWGLRRDWPAPWASRLGCQMVMLSGLAFAAQGVFSLDSSDLDGVLSQRHAAAWMGWWLAFVTGAGLLAWGGRGSDARALVTASALAAPALVLLTIGLPAVIGPAWAPRAGVAVWLAWLVIAGRVSRSAA